MNAFVQTDPALSGEYIIKVACILVLESSIALIIVVCLRVSVISLL